MKTNLFPNEVVKRAEEYHPPEMAGKGENERGRDTSEVIGSKVDESAGLLAATAPDNTCHRSIN